MNKSAQILFELIDQRLDDTARETRNQVFSIYRDVPWTPEQRKVLQPLIRKELDTLVLRILNLFDNVGGVLPDEVSGWTINDADTDTDISIDNADYANMWREYLSHKTQGKD